MNYSGPCDLQDGPNAESSAVVGGMELDRHSVAETGMSPQVPGTGCSSTRVAHRPVALSPLSCNGEVTTVLPVDGTQERGECSSKSTLTTAVL